MTGKANKLARGALALFTVALLVVTFYFPLIGFGYSIDPTADLRSRGTGLLLFLPSVALVILLAGIVAAVRSKPSFWLGIAGTALILPSIGACAILGWWGLIGSATGLSYLAIWWFLAQARLTGTRVNKVEKPARPE